jgi:hypothetical protein
VNDFKPMCITINCMRFRLVLTERSVIDSSVSGLIRGLRDQRILEFGTGSFGVRIRVE